MLMITHWILGFPRIILDSFESSSKEAL